MKETLRNEQIVLSEVRLIGANGEQLGIMSSAKALEIAQNDELDLVLIAPNGQPPVCRVMDYAKFKFDEMKKLKEQKRAQKVAETKAMLADKVSAVEMNIIECILGSPMMSQAAIAGKLGMTHQYIGRCMDELQKRQIVRHVGPKKGGHWELVQTKA